MVDRSEKATDVTIVLDRSGSMEAIRSDVVGAFNAFVHDQQQRPGECRLTLVQFDDEYEVVCRARLIADVPDLNHDSFVPRGSTALLDAIGRTIRELDKRLADAGAPDGAARVLVAILTDGLENASTDFKRDDVFRMIKERTDQGWAFLFLAANQDAIMEGGQIGIGAAQSLNFMATAAGVHKGTQALSDALAAFRSSGKASFDPSSRPAKKIH
ncbi:MAG TPA: vWA domain-containing protein [Vicinamibacterales bacterium]|jgi:Mg-chelatase subunit ChlD|nr:vWA domain-containing protein [Vicinamibacterales bacterium]